MIRSLRLINKNILLSNRKTFTTTSTNNKSNQTQFIIKDDNTVELSEELKASIKLEEQKKIVKEVMEKPQSSKFLKGDVLLEGVKSDGSSLRWYKTAGMCRTEPENPDQGYYPLIDERKIRTPSNHVIITPSKEIAYAVAAEWRAQEKYIKPSRLPITQTIISCLDVRPEGRFKIIGEFINHLATDPICNREKNDSKLKKLQSELYEPILQFANEYYGIPFSISTHLSISKHPKELLDKIERHLHSMNNWELVCLQLISQSSKSFLVALSLYYGKLRLDNLYQTIALEEEYQSETWGRIPFGHDLAECETHNEIAPPLFMLRNMNPIPLPK
ncbi:ATP synthase mitochondrial F1 complex assembly factor 2 [Dictyostelium discoideum AX4]|uniref:ATP synthase mitochondrial F1 complex assembly factor 2 n=1 Tax=Dictyostelium discoideum TaxID=44689 RepID=Q54CV4_DICDI|nr:ATP synthase mitochondrial F1 complex assembly factor 2 [Dictyostelium discoideum AX4]EAL61142.1 ATP synthase mitochondrial F1 complex assembly factor 2 [Dictyostelium discoideum AX4]|eukprot:XP_629566.1 ATP synthase mitochondrial F1 complex assembly factor 2 [Dictyostelium discoideum AX4]